MCGIAGFVNRAGQQADRAIVERMTAALVHRGPDGDGFYCAGPVALGHRRLSIIDVTGGAQPMANEDGTIWVTYNGELYNELEIRPQLEAKGHRYQTVSDTESLVHLYEEDGVDFVRRLNGMFALAIWDQPRQRLVLARDRMGQKPLFYAELPGGGLAFGSEPKAVLCHPEVGRELDRDSLARYLFYEYIPAPHFDLARAVETAARPCTDLGAGIDPSCPVLAIVGSGDGRRRRALRAGRRPVLEHLCRCGGPPSPVGRAAGRVPLRRRRFLERCRGALRDRAGPERAHFLDRVQGA